MPIPNLHLHKLISLFITVFALLLSSCSNKQPESTETADSPQQKVETPEVKLDTIGAPQLVRVYEENEINADNQLKDKEFIVYGMVQDISKDILNDIYITLRSSKREYALRNVQCFGLDASVAGSIKKGQIVLLKGRCEGLMMNVIMRECTLLQIYNRDQVNIQW